MKVINLGEKDSILNKFVAQLRDKKIQKDSMRFRRNLERIGEIFAYEISKTMQYSSRQVNTPLGIAETNIYDDNVVVATILRAGLPLHQGILNYFDDAQNAFVAAYRKYDKGEGFHINIEYATTPDLTDKTLILADTMLATGASLEMAYNRLRENGEPKHTHIVCPVASSYAVEYLQKNIDGCKATLWVAAIDEELTSKSYIIPGLGDAGDLAYGIKK
jgi:uracil phosphoribosyltransferase